MKKIFVSISFFYMFIYFCGSPLFAQDEKVKIAFFNPAMKSDIWWVNASKIMKAACDDFGFDLSIYWAERNQYLMSMQLKKALSQKNKPDVVVFQSQKMNGPIMLQLAEKAKTLAFIFNAGLSDQLGHKKKYGLPREKLKYWIGQMLPDDEKAGYDVANVLIKLARKKGLVDPAGKINIVGYEGTVSDSASISRLKGLERAVKENDDVRLLQTVSAFWDRKIAEKIFMQLKIRHPSIRVVWAANDPMALGVIDSMKKNNLKPGTDIIIGSVDWIPDALKAIKNGELAVSAGGHFLEAGWLIVLIYDYLNGKDFKSESVDLKSQMGILTQKNVATYFNNFGEGHWDRIDYKKFSKKINPHLSTYQFTLEAAINALK